METKMFNPDEFSITQSKAFGIWPPSDIIAHGLYPYIHRLKASSVKVLDVGIMKGEGATFLLERDFGRKIEKVYGIKSYDPSMTSESIQKIEKLLQENVAGNTKISLEYDDSPVDVVCIHANSDLDNVIEKYYNALNSNGIFCGNEHHLPRVKESLHKFRRKNKIGTPIMVSNGSWFWYKRNCE